MSLKTQKHPFKPLKLVEMNVQYVLVNSIASAFLCSVVQISYLYLAYPSILCTDIRLYSHVILLFNYF